MATFIYALCTLTALGCCVLLMRGYLRSTTKLLFWAGLCFAGLAISNLIVVIDKIVLPLQDLSPWRVSVSVVSVGVLLFGLIFEDR